MSQVGKESELQKLRKENAELKAELAKLKKENGDVETFSKAGPAKTGSRKSSK